MAGADWSYEENIVSTQETLKITWIGKQDHLIEFLESSKSRAVVEGKKKKRWWCIV